MTGEWRDMEVGAQLVDGRSNEVAEGFRQRASVNLRIQASHKKLVFNESLLRIPCHTLLRRMFSCFRFCLGFSLQA